MRQKLNENPVAQIALVGVMILVVGFLFISKMGGGEGSSAEASSEAAPTEEAALPTGATATAAPGTSPVIPPSTAAAAAPLDRRMPRAVETAYGDNKTVALLIVRDGAIDDHLVLEASTVLGGMSRVAFFSTKVKHVARFAQITGPLGVNQAPALVVIRPKVLNGSEPAPASVLYGFQTKADLRQEIRNAVYRGRTLTYAPN